MEFLKESGRSWCDSADFYQDSDIHMCKAHLEYLDSGRKKHRQKVSGWTAQIIQHEVDHLKGVII